MTYENTRNQHNFTIIIIFVFTVDKLLLIIIFTLTSTSYKVPYTYESIIIHFSKFPYKVIILRNKISDKTEGMSYILYVK